jgi:Integral peroxisomal membrane peroxin
VLGISYGLLPLLLLGPKIGPYLPQRWKKQRATPTTEAALASSLSSLDAVYALKPDVVLHDPLPSELTFMQRLRILGLLLPPFVALTYWVPLRILVAIVGTIILTYRAPWIVTTRRILSRSGYARATWRYIVGWLSGNTTLPLPIISRKKTLLSTESMTPPNEKGKVRKHKFVFTVLENQRWWVGIDWTPALLPSDRPSWCAPISPLASGAPQSPASSSTQTSYIPLPPPASFPLPPATSVVLPSPTGKGFMKKTARWQWEENGEWEVLVHKEGEREVKKLRIPVAANEDLPKGVLAKAAGKMGVLSSPTRQSFNENEESSPTSTKTPQSAAFPADNGLTDQDGWIYSDNKWENTAPKGGMGKVRIYISPSLESLTDLPPVHSVQTMVPDCCTG